MMASRSPGAGSGSPAFSEASDAAVVRVIRPHLGNPFLHHCGRQKLVKHRSQDDLLCHAATDTDGVFCMLSLATSATASSSASRSI
jgi:hypothetical protein